MASESEKIKRANQKLFETLLTDPEKKAKVLELLTQEGLVSFNHENIAPNFSPITRYNSPVKKLHKNGIQSLLSSKPAVKTKPNVESPSALGRRRALQRLESDSSADDPLEKHRSPPIKGPQLPYNQILKDVIAYCEVRTNGEDRSSSIKTMIRALGATVRDKITRDVTHVIFKDGLYSTFRKAQNSKMHIVSILWIDAIRRHKCRIPEGKYKPLDMDKYNNIRKQSDVMQEMQAEFNDLVRDEHLKSAEKRRNSEILNGFVTERKSTVSRQSVAADMNRTELSSLFKDKIEVPVLSESDSNISEDLSENGNFNNDKQSEFIGRSQTDHINSPNMSKIVEETSFNQLSSPKINIKHVRNSLELKRVQKIKSPQNLIRKSNESKRTSSNKSSLIDNDESLRLHITTTTDQSSTGNRTRSLSDRYAQKLVSSETVTRLDSGEKLTTNKSRLSDDDKLQKIVKDDSITRSDLNRISTGTRSSTNSIDLLKGPMNSKTSKTIVGPACSKESSIDRVQSKIPNNNGNLAKKTNNLMNDDNLLNYEKTGNNKESAEENDLLTQSTAKKSKARKLYNKEHINEELFKWDQVKEVQQDISGTPPKKMKFQVVLPKEFPKTLSTRARKKASVVKQPATISKIQPSNQNLDDNVNKRTRRSAKILDFGNKTSDEKSTESSCGTDYISKFINYASETNVEKKSTRKSILKINSVKNNNENNISEKKIDEKTPNIKYPEIKIPPKRGKRKSEAHVTKAMKENKSSATGSLELNTVTTRPRRKSSVALNYKILNSSSEENEAHSNISDDSFVTANSDTSSIKQSDNFVGSDTENNSTSLKGKINSQCYPQTPRQNTPGRSTRLSSVAEDTPKTSKKLPITPNNLRKEVSHKTPKIKSQTTNMQRTPNRRSTLEFVPPRSPRISKNPKPTPLKKRSIVCTRFHKPDVQVFQQIVKKLGSFIVENEVTKITTHLICGDPSRTINLLKAIVRGCWVVRKEWLFKSLESGRWLDEEDYEMTEFSPVVQKCRLQKQTFGSLYSMDLFKNCGTIFVSRGSSPRCSDLEELVQLCGGRVVRTARDADIVVGEKVHNNEQNATSVTEKWILDCITVNKKKSFKSYKFKSSPEM